MSRYTQIEVQVQQNDRWSIHAQYPVNKKDDAVSEARKIEKTPGFDAVKVIKEVYDSREGFHREYTIYKGPRDFQEHKGYRDIGGAPSSKEKKEDEEPDWSLSGDDDYYQDDANPDEEFYSDEPVRKKKFAPRKQSTVANALVKMLFLALASLVVAIGFSVLFSTYFHGKTLFGIRMAGAAEANALFVIFVVSFLLTAISLSVAYFKNISLTDGKRRPGKRIGAVMSFEQASAIESAQDAVLKEEGSVRDWLNEANGDLSIQAEQPGEDSTQPEQSREDLETNDRLRDKLADQKPEDAAAVITQEGAGASVDQAGDMDDQGRKQKAYMMKFLTQLMAAAGGDKKKLDNHTKFGLNLFLAGACETLASKKGMNQGVRARILADTVQVLGFKKSHAAAFAERYEEYLMQDSRYMSMFQAGRNAMHNHIDDNVSGLKHMVSALKEWNQPKQKHEQTHVIAVMFTDIANSTALTQKLGDAGAQEVIRAHNKVVREALTMYKGKEVKHTGDGMMMSFEQPTNAVLAAVTIQREINKFRAANPAKPLQVKIGVNAGEPICEDNDLFGTTVQLAARIVDKANVDQILVSDTVKGICTGKGFGFTNRGGFKMKGFSEDVVLYEVSWRAAPEAKAS